MQGRYGCLLGYTLSNDVTAVARSQFARAKCTVGTAWRAANAMSYPRRLMFHLVLAWALFGHDQAGRHPRKRLVSQLAQAYRVLPLAGGAEYVLCLGLH